MLIYSRILKVGHLHQFMCFREQIFSYSRSHLSSDLKLIERNSKGCTVDQVASWMVSPECASFYSLSLRQTANSTLLNTSLVGLVNSVNHKKIMKQNSWFNRCITDILRVLFWQRKSVDEVVNS